MITAQDVFDYLSLGSLSQAGLETSPTSYLEVDSYDGVNNDGSINETHNKQLLQFIQLGLRDLYLRHKLKESALVLAQREGVNSYALTIDNAVSQGGALIVDTEDNPFTGDLVKIVQIRNNNRDVVPINMWQQYDSGPTKPKTIYMNKFNNLIITDPVEGNYFYIAYMADHPKLPMGEDVDLNLIDLDIPDSLFQCLLYYVSWKFYASSLGDSMQYAEDYKQKYLDESTKIKRLDLNSVQSPAEKSAIIRGGWNPSNMGYYY